MNGYRLTIADKTGMVFQCPYREDERDAMNSAIKNLLTGERTALIVRCEEPPEMTMERWLAEGGTND